MNIYNTIIQKHINNINCMYFAPDINNMPIPTSIPSTSIPSPNIPLFGIGLLPVCNRIQSWHAIMQNEIIVSNIDTIIKIIYYIYIDKTQLQNTTKFQLLVNVFENPFYNKQIKDQFLTYFSKIQRTYFSLVKFVKCIKHKRSALYNTTDIVMNPICRYSSRVFELYQNNKIYLFTRPDIINIMNAALSHSPNFFSYPLPIKNPYNNMFFKKSDLYNMYFFIQTGMFIISDIIQKFFLSHFDLQVFQDENEYIIRNFYIYNYVETSPASILYLEIKNMLVATKFTHQIRIHSEFPKEKLVEIMKPYLLLYFQSLYSTDEYRCEDCMNMLVIQLVRFTKFNPKFGRRIIKKQPYVKLYSNYMFRSRKPAYKNIVFFYDKYIPFFKKTNFLTSHTNR
jgi:hypothetical protein